MKLPEPNFDGGFAVEAALRARRSVRDYGEAPLSLAEVSQLLWAAQGVNAPEGYRTAPSAGALYPLEIHLVAGNVESLSAGIYKYAPRRHKLRRTSEGDLRARVSAIALHQEWIAESAAIFVFAAVVERATRKYRQRGRRYILLETGHAAQNVLLQAAALDLGAAVVGAFDDGELKKAVGMSRDEAAVYILTIGHERR